VAAEGDETGRAACLHIYLGGKQGRVYQTSVYMGLAFQATPAHLRWAYVLSSLIEEPSFFLKLQIFFVTICMLGDRAVSVKSSVVDLSLSGASKAIALVLKKKQSH
jgi:hypothetical protein